MKITNEKKWSLGKKVKKKLRRTDEINALIKYYKNMEIPLKKKKKKKKKKEMNSLN